MTPQSNPFGRKRHETPTAEELLANINRPLPFSDEAEKGTISSLLQDPINRVSVCRVDMTSEAFYHEANRTIYEKLLEFDEKGVPFDPVLVTNALRDQGILERVGGPAAITELFTFVPSPSHFEHYRAIVMNCWKRRRLIHGCMVAADLAFNPTAHADWSDTDSVLSSAKQAFEALTDGFQPSAHTSATLAQCLDEHIEQMQAVQDRRQAGKEPLIPIGLPTLDKLCGGIGINEYVVVTGPTKSGKSIFTGNIVVHASRRGWKSKIYTNEVNRVAYTGRVICAQTDALDGGVERRGFDDNDQMHAYGKAVTLLKRELGHMIQIDNAAGRYVEDIAADIRTSAREGFQLFVVDLIGKLQSRRAFLNREQEIAYFSSVLFAAGKRNNVALIVVAQENDDGRVRESRSLEFDCEAWFKVCHVLKTKEPQRRGFSTVDSEPEYDRTRRNIVVQLARGFASGDVIPCFFDGPKFRIGEIERQQP